MLEYCAGKASRVVCREAERKLRAEIGRIRANQDSMGLSAGS
jgi:hypothetical protein